MFGYQTPRRYERVHARTDRSTREQSPLRSNNRLSKRKETASTQTEAMLPLLKPIIPSTTAPIKDISVVRVPRDSKILEEIHLPIIHAPISENPLRRPNETINNMPDFRHLWGPYGWEDRRLFWFFANTSNDHSPAHGWYALFVAWDHRGMAPNENINFRGLGRSIHSDVFVAKVAYHRVDRRGFANFVDMPREFVEWDMLNTAMGNDAVSGFGEESGYSRECYPVLTRRRVMKEVVSG